MDTGPGAAGLNVSAVGPDGKTPLQVMALLEAESAHRATVRGIRVVPRSIVYYAPD